jgi:hypothetical protein
MSGLRRNSGSGRPPGTGQNKPSLARGLGRRGAGRLLDGAGPPSDPLEPWMSAVRAGAVATEFPDEEQQLAQFRAAQAAAQIAGPAHAAGSGRRITRVKAVVAAGVATGLAAVTGVAVAGAAGVLPARFQRPAHNIFHAPAPASTSRPFHSPSGGRPSSSPSVSRTSPSATPSARPTSAPTQTPTPSNTPSLPTTTGVPTTKPTRTAPGSARSTSPAPTLPTVSHTVTPTKPSKSSKASEPSKSPKPSKSSKSAKRSKTPKAEADTQPN